MEMKKMISIAEKRSPRFETQPGRERDKCEMHGSIIIPYILKWLKSNVSLGLLEPAKNKDLEKQTNRNKGSLSLPLTICSCSISCHAMPYPPKTQRIK